jgi:hypothetical protein
VIVAKYQSHIVIHNKALHEMINGTNSIVSDDFVMMLLANNCPFGFGIQHLEV